MMGSETTNHQDTAIKVLRTRRNMFVEFEFQWGDPDLAVELVLPYLAFREFCAEHHSRMISADAETEADFHALQERFATTTPRSSI
jgi:phenol hydroxylase P0 protein